MKRDVQNQVFVLFADCIPVEGFQRASICDLGRGEIYLVPKSLYFFIQNFEGRSLSGLFNRLNSNDKEIIYDYFDHLENHELIFWCKKTETKLFPKIKPKWGSPSVISNAIIEFNPSLFYKKMLAELNELGCHYFQFRLENLNAELINQFSYFLQTLEQSYPNLTMFEILAPHHSKMIDDFFLKEMSNYIQLQCITFYNHKSDSKQIINNLNIKYTTQDLNNYPIRSNVSFNSFFPNYDFFFESRTRNPYYSGKIAIDVIGNIKNTPGDQKYFGNIQSNSIIEIVRSQIFKKLWYSSKDKIQGCQNCEFRYICFDNRPILFDEVNNIYKSEVECNYNPLTSEWKNSITGPSSVNKRVAIES